MGEPISATQYRIAEALARIREQKPLIHHITNVVAVNEVANVTLHLGALPVMAHALEEVSEMTALARALVLNLGTPDAARIEAMFIAGQRANQVGIPIVLDPVGAGATRLRTDTALRLLGELAIAVVRGNSGEIGALAGAGGRVMGVQSVEGPDDPAAVSRRMARKRRLVVALTGERDLVSDGSRVLGVDNGHRWLTTVSGTGDMATTVVAVFAAVESDRLLATAGGLACLGLAAERAAQEAYGPASFRVALLDQLYHLTPEQLAAGARIVTVEAPKEEASRAHI
ncbi:MAG: hydroxyethylthiazole kinase [Anaerolineae bacterium]